MRTNVGWDWTGQWMVWVLFAAAVVFFLTYRDVRLSTRAGIALGIFEVGVFAALAIWMILSNLGDLTLQTFDPTNAEAGTFNGIFKGMVFCILAFIGFESSAPLAEETRDPRRNIPKAVLGACLGVGLFYVLCSYAWVIGTGFPNFTTDTLAQANPWQHLGDVYWSTGWVLIFLAIVNSALANSNAGVNASSRVIFAMGRNGVLPRAFARTHPEHRTPHVAIIAQTVFGVVLALLLGWKWGPLNGFGVISFAATSLVIVVYISVCLATISYYWRKARAEWNWWLHGIFPALGALAFLPPLYYQYRPLAPEPLRFGNFAAIAAFVLTILVTAYVAMKQALAARQRRPDLRRGGVRRPGRPVRHATGGRELMAAVAVDHVVTRDQVIWGFGPDLEPVLEVEPGATVRFETNDCFTGQIQSEADLVSDIDFSRVNSATGPVAVRGAEPGDSLSSSCSRSAPARAASRRSSPSSGS